MKTKSVMPRRITTIYLKYTVAIGVLQKIAVGSKNTVARRHARSALFYLGESKGD
jgi:hypothetical protein